MSHLPSQRAAGEGTADVRYAGGEQYADDEFMFNGSIPPPHRLSQLYSTSPRNSRDLSSPYPAYRDSPSPSRSPPPPGTGSGSGSTSANPISTTSTSLAPAALPLVSVPAVSAGAATSSSLSTQTPTPFASASAAAAAGGTRATQQQSAVEYAENPFMPNAQFSSNNTGAYQTMNSSSPWLEKQERSNSRAKKIVIGSIVAIVVIVAVAVGVGVGVSKSKSSSSSSNLSSSGSGSVQSNSDDPSDFTKNSSLVQSFYGIAYTPEGSQLPDCGNSLDAVITDIQLLSQLTTRIRIYGADCNQSALVLEAIERTKVNMTVYLGIYNVFTDAGEAYVRQRDYVTEAIKTYGTDHIAGVTVGNEFMLNWATDQGISDVNTAVGNTGAALLLQNITDMKTTLSDMSIDLPVGTSDAGSYFNNEVLAAVDYGMANVHPWFANTTIDDAAGWTYTFFQDTDIAQAEALSNNPKMYIAETGWPTKSSDAGNESNGASTASVANLQTFLDTFVCQANTNGTGYFFFEYFDEAWKDAQFGGVEGWWGLFDKDRNLKAGLTIPTCS